MARALSAGQNESARQIQQDLVRQSKVVINALEDLKRVIAKGGHQSSHVSVRVVPGTQPVGLSR